MIIAAKFVYECFGLTWSIGRAVRTLDLALIPAGFGPADVSISFGPLPELVPSVISDDLELTIHDRALHIFVEEVGRFRIRDGSEIIVDPLAGVTEAEIDLYLAGSVMAAVLHQRGILPLHCNAFEVAGRAVLICGDSGAGKSTLACALEARGHALLTDDVCAVTFNSKGRPIGHPGLPRLRLWPDARIALGRSEDAGLPIPWSEGKIELSMGGARVTEPLEIATIYHLQDATDGQAMCIKPLNVLESIDVVSSSIYRRRIADVIGESRGYLTGTIRIAKSVSVHAFVRQRDLEKLEHGIDMLLEHLS